MDIAKFYTNQVDEETTQFLIQLKRPCRVFRRRIIKIANNKNPFEEIESPFAFKAPDKLFMNYFNIS